MSNAEAIMRMQTNRMLSVYPCIEKIIHKNSLFYQTTRDQYNGDSSEERKEATLGGILYALSFYREFIEMMDKLNEWICRYPEYQTKQFGKKLKENFFNYYSEVEVFHHFKENSIQPILNPKINSTSGKNLDFAINLGSNQFLIEVLTPRMSKDLEEQIEDGGCGFFDPARGIGPKNEGPHSRVSTLILEEIAKHIDLSSEIADAPIILIINNTIAEWEIPGTENPFDSLLLPGSICGILFYNRNGGSHFFENPKCEIDEASIQFFKGLL